MKGPRKTVPENSEKLEQEETKGREEPILDTLAFVPRPSPDKFWSEDGGFSYGKTSRRSKMTTGSHFKTRDSTESYFS